MHLIAFIRKKFTPTSNYSVNDREHLRERSRQCKHAGENHSVNTRANNLQ